MARMHPTDKAIFWLSALGSLVVGAVMFTCDVLHDRYQADVDKAPSVPKPNIDVSCMSPEHFSEAMVTYADSVCEGKLMRIILGQPEDETPEVTIWTIPANDSVTPDKVLKKSDILPEHYHVFMSMSQIRAAVSKSMSAVQKNIITDRKTKLYWYIAAQLFLAFLTFVCTSNIALYSTWYSQQLGKETTVFSTLVSQRRLSTFYLILQLLSCLSWLIVACLCFTHCVTADIKAADPDRLKYSNEADLYHSGTFLCEFHSRRLGSIQKYSIQCAYDVELPPSDLNGFQPNRMHIPLNLAARINVAMCAIISVMAMFHIIHTYAIMPSVHCSALMACNHSGTFRNLAQITRPDFGMSDLNIVLMFSVVSGTMKASGSITQQASETLPPSPTSDPTNFHQLKPFQTIHNES